MQRSRCRQGPPRAGRDRSSLAASAKARLCAGQRDHVDLPDRRVHGHRRGPNAKAPVMTTAGLACRSPAGLRPAGRAVRGAGLAGVSLAGVAAAGAAVPRRDTYPRPRQDAPPQRRPAAVPAPADRMVAAVVLGASGPVGTVRTHDPRAGTIDWDDPQAAADFGDP